MPILLRAGALAAAAALALVPLAAATEETATEAAAPSWVPLTDIVRSVDSNDAGDEPDFYTYTKIIQTENAGNAILFLGCSVSSTGDSRLSTGLQLDPENGYQQDPDYTLHVVRVSGRVKIGDDKPKMERWIYHAKSTRLTPMFLNTALARRLYNAAATVSPVEVKTMGKTYRIETPQHNDVLADFVASCPVTNGTGEFDETIFENARKADMASDES